MDNSVVQEVGGKVEVDKKEPRQAAAFIKDEGALR
jgi:hypothetical protein